ncbi:MAG: hypothetical protein C5B57_10480 [Blastocatellia bacterium]|nr:MAG: hypothetical protein C5B57_10480 [Blastocatellia bacterium]
MAHAFTVHGALVGIGRFLEHAVAIVIGLALMIIGLGLGVTMVMLPVGITIGLLGVAILVAGMFARIGDDRA